MEKCLIHYSLKYIEKMSESTTQLNPEITSDNQELQKNFYQKQLHAVGMPCRNVKTFLTDMVLKKLHGKCKQLLVFSGLMSMILAVYYLGFKKVPWFHALPSNS